MDETMKRTRVLIMGAAGRDFHNFNVVYRNNPYYKVVCFTAAQIPGIANRPYPAILAGKLYPQGIPIFSEDQLESLIQKHQIEKVVLSYSDLSHQDVMDKASRVNASGATFVLLAPQRTMLKSKKPVIAVCAVRTGCGKSSTSQKIAFTLKQQGRRVVVIRHPMPYGDLAKQICERMTTPQDLLKYHCTIEEREEYEAYVNLGIPIYAGVDYEKILRQAEQEADLIIWDGGNNDTPFYKPDVHVVIADPHRLGHEQTYYPGAINIRMADIVIINKTGSAPPENVVQLEANVKKLNPQAKIIKADLTIDLKDPKLINKIKGKRAVIVEDGPTLTHGGMTFGAGTLAAKKYHLQVVNPKPHAVGSLKAIYKKYPKLGNLVPAMGYSAQQMKELQETLNRAPADLIVIGTPMNLGKLLKLKKPAVRITYKLQEIGHAHLIQFIQECLRRKK